MSIMCWLAAFVESSGNHPVQGKAVVGGGSLTLSNYDAKNPAFRIPESH
ncbi:hypothetical protein [Klebsiella sp. BIGb0407]|nr:hypothetical protein [Klebsiella sp. BIGb0407]MCS3433301.1 hypothetical protein [Klebsiella sp. BIGb0407]